MSTFRTIKVKRQVAKELTAEEVAKQDAILFEKFGEAFNLQPSDSNLPTFDLEGNQVG